MFWNHKALRSSTSSFCSFLSPFFFFFFNLCPVVSILRPLAAYSHPSHSCFLLVWRSGLVPLHSQEINGHRGLEASLSEFNRIHLNLDPGGCGDWLFLGLDSAGVPESIFLIETFTSSPYFYIRGHLAELHIPEAHGVFLPES